jgi:lysophospholipase L1-like esterase
MPTYDGYGNVLAESGGKANRFVGKKAGCLGDSLTAMGAVWQNRLAEKLGLGEIVNYGVSGTTVTSARGEGETTFRDRAPNMADDLDLIIVLTSINDYGTNYGVYNKYEGTGTLGSATDKTVNDVSTIAGAGVELINILQDKYPGKDIVFFSHPHQNEWSFGETDKYAEICGYRGVPFFDLLRFSGIDASTEERKTRYFTDGIHLSTEGNYRVADFMASCLATML